MSKQTPESDQVSSAPAETATVRAWAEKAGHLPENLPGDYLHPSKHNPQSWLVRAACLRLGVALDSSINERTYLDAVASVATADAR
jgi:hypothetical protein